jgi:hypothetical protein
VGRPIAGTMMRLARPTLFLLLFLLLLLLFLLLPAALSPPVTEYTAPAGIAPPDVADAG